MLPTAQGAPPSMRNAAVRLDKVWVLSLASLRGVLNYNDIRYGASPPARRRAIVQLVAVALASMEAIGLSGYLVYEMLQSPFIAGRESSVLMLLATAMSAGTLVLSTYTVTGGLFRFKGYDQIACLPVSTTEMVLSRVVVTALFDVVVALVLVMPGGVVYGLATSVEWYYWPALVLATPVLTLIPYSLGAAFGYITMRATARVRSSQMLNAALTMAGLIGFMWAVNSAEADGGNGLAALASRIGSASGDLYPPATWFTDLLSKGSLSAGLALLGASAVVGTAVVWFLGKVFVSANTAVGGGRRPRAARGVSKLRARSSFTALLGAEAKRLTSSALYMLNSSFGLVMIAVGGVALLFVDPVTIEQVLDVPGLAAALTSLTPLVLGAMVAFTGISANAVSLEGSSLWIIRSAPVSARQVLLAKASFAALTPLPFIAVGATGAVITLEMSVGGAVATYLIPAIVSALIAVAGLLANLWLPKFDWRAEVEVIKQSMAVIVTLVFGMAVAAVPFVAMKYLEMKAVTLLWVTAGFDVILLASGFWLLMTWGARRWDTLS